MTGGDRANDTLSRVADALMQHHVPSPVDPGEMPMSGIFDWPTLLGIADAALAAAAAVPDPAAPTEDRCPFCGGTNVEPQILSGGLVFCHTCDERDALRKEVQRVYNHGHEWMNTAEEFRAERDALRDTVERIEALCESGGAVGPSTGVRFLTAEAVRAALVPPSPGDGEPGA